MLRNFRRQFEAWSFDHFGRGAYSRREGPLWQSIYETRLSVGVPQFRVNLGIGIYDPFLEDCGQAEICLRGDLEPEGISTHFDETPFWWDGNDVERAQAVMEKCAPPWFQYWSVDRLVSYFEKPVRNVSFRFRVRAPVVPKIDKGSIKRRPPVHDHWLSLLYYHQKDYQRALLHCERHFEIVKYWNNGGSEPERTLRQIASLKDALASHF